MQTQQAIRCPNCGSMARRYFWIDSQTSEKTPRENCLTRSECLNCDYFLVTHTQTGNVLESYAPGIKINSDRNNLSKIEKREKYPAIATI